MKNTSVVVIEDEEDILELISYNLRREGFDVKGATSGEDGLALVASSRPGIVLLDLMLPGVSGLKVCKRLKANPDLQSIPVLMVSAKGDESDIIAGLEMGADDYVTKPFSPKILVARVHAVLRRSHGSKVDSKDQIVVHELVIEPSRFQATLADQSLNLTKDEFHLLCFLARHPGWVFTRYQIVNGIKGENYVVTERTIDVRIAGLRKKLGKFSDYIETVRGVGYRFKEI
jgi:two-component system alkaline phosphatase synthesis response regulator PhoP